MSWYNLEVYERMEQRPEVLGWRRGSDRHDSLDRGSQNMLPGLGEDEGQRVGL
jgi:hypothetical protein